MVYTHGIPPAMALDAVNCRGSAKHLASILKKPSRQSDWENAVYFLGFTGDPGATKDLLEFFRSGPATGKITDLEYYAKVGVPAALGLLVYTMDHFPSSMRGENPAERTEATRQEALDFLARLAKPQPLVWERQVKWQVALYPPAKRGEMFVNLSRHCLEGLAMTGSTEAEAYLGKLESHARELTAGPAAAERSGYPKGMLNESFLESFLADIERSKAMRDGIAKNGLTAYFQR